MQNAFEEPTLTHNTLRRTRARSVKNNRDGIEFKELKGTATKHEFALEVVEHAVGTQDIASVCPTTRDTSLDDVLASTTVKPDGW